MARKVYGFRQRFPFSGLFLVIAVAVAIPLTVWSLQNTSTITKQQAQVQKCGSYNQNPSCPKDFVCKFTSNNPLFGGYCNLSSLDTPSNLNINSTCKYNSEGPNSLNLSLGWDKVNNATGYLIYGSYEYMSEGNISNVNLGPFTTNNNLYSRIIPIPKGVKYINFRVKAINNVFNILSIPSKLESISLNCQ